MPQSVTFIGAGVSGEADDVFSHYKCIRPKYDIKTMHDYAIYLLPP